MSPPAGVDPEDVGRAVRTLRNGERLHSNHQ